MNLRKICLALACFLCLASGAFASANSSIQALSPAASEREDYDDWFGKTDICAIAVPEENQSFTSIDGVLFSKDGKELLLYPSGRSGDRYEVPAGTVRLADECAFWYGCPIKTLVLPSSFRYFGSYSCAMTQIESFEVAEDNPFFSTIDGVLFSKDGTILYAYPPAKRLETYTVPNGVISIADTAFYCRDFPKHITMPDSLLHIGDCAFEEAGIESIGLPQQMVSIGAYAFASCADLQCLVLPTGISDIPAGMLLGDTALHDSLVIPEGVTHIGDEALINIGVSDLYLPDSLLSVTDFSNAELEDIKIENNDLLSFVFGKSCDWSYLNWDADTVIHAHEGTFAAEITQGYQRIILPAGADVPGREVFVEYCAAAAAKDQRLQGYKLVDKRLVAYQPDEIIAVFGDGKKFALCDFIQVQENWLLNWKNDTIFSSAVLPQKLAFYGLEELKIIWQNGVYCFCKSGAELLLKDVIHYDGDDWDAEADWQARVVDGQMLFEELEYEGDPILVQIMNINPSALRLRDMEELPIYCDMAKC